MFIYWLEQMLTMSFRQACRWNDVTKDLQNDYWTGYQDGVNHSSYPKAWMDDNDYTEY